MTAPGHRFAKVQWAGGIVDIEHQWLNTEASAHPPGSPPASSPGISLGTGPLMVFLHEGLGSVSMWRDFPARLCARLGWPGLVYSRPGYGQSTLRPQDQPLPADFLERQALEVLPALLRALGVDGRQRPLWLLGHSDGGSIALIHAARHSNSVAGLVVMAPHIMVEDISVLSIAQARVAYQTTDLPQRLARHHRDVDATFYGWNDVWLSPAFRSWSIEGLLPALRCPVLALQGENDEYGTPQQVHGIARAHALTTVELLTSCGHSPHRDQTEAVLDRVARFVHAPEPMATNHTELG